MQRQNILNVHVDVIAWFMLEIISEPPLQHSAALQPARRPGNYLQSPACCRPFTSISRDCSHCCTRICRPLNLICNLKYLRLWAGEMNVPGACGLVTVSRDIEVFVSWHQEILICKYLRSSCCTFPHIITLSSQQSTFKHFCHTQLSRLRYLHCHGRRSPVSSFIKIYKSPALCGVQSSRWEKAISKHPLF